MIMTYRNAWLPEVFNDFFDTENMPKANATAPAINVKETPSEYVVEMAAPGMRKEDFGVHINNDGDLTVKMECKRNERRRSLVTICVASLPTQSLSRLSSCLTMLTATLSLQRLKMVCSPSICLRSKERSRRLVVTLR